MRVRCTTYVMGAAIMLAVIIALTPGSTGRAQQPAITIEALREATYPVDVIPGRAARLTAGHFEVAAAPGSASKATADLITAAIGTLGGRPRAAVVIASSGGGSGTFFELHVVDADGSALAKEALGDRIRVNAITINTSGTILVDMLTRGPGEPLASATVPVTRAYGVSAAGALAFLEPFSAPASTPAPAPVPARTGNAGLGHDGTPGGERGGGAREAILLAMVVAGAWGARRLDRRSQQRGHARLAVAAPAVDLQPVRLDLIAGALGDARHQLLHVARGEVTDRAALGADQVMVVVGRTEPVGGATVVQDDLTDHLEVLEQPERAEHGGAADRRRGLHDIVRSEVIAQTQHRLKERAARRGEPEPAACERAFDGLAGRGGWHSIMVARLAEGCQRDASAGARAPLEVPR